MELNQKQDEKIKERNNILAKFKAEAKDFLTKIRPEDIKLNNYYDTIIIDDKIQETVNDFEVLKEKIRNAPFQSHEIQKVS